MSFGFEPSIHGASQNFVLSKGYEIKALCIFSMVLHTSGGMMNHNILTPLVVLPEVCNNIHQVTTISFPSRCPCSWLYMSAYLRPPERVPLETMHQVGDYKALDSNSAACRATLVSSFNFLRVLFTFYIDY